MKKLLNALVRLVDAKTAVEEVRLESEKVYLRQELHEEKTRLTRLVEESQKASSKLKKKVK